MTSLPFLSTRCDEVAEESQYTICSSAPLPESGCGLQDSEQAAPAVHHQQGRPVCLPLHLPRSQVPAPCPNKDDIPRYCSLSVVKRWSYLMMDLCCPALEIERHNFSHIPIEQKSFKNVIKHELLNIFITTSTILPKFHITL